MKFFFLLSVITISSFSFSQQNLELYVIEEYDTTIYKDFLYDQGFGIEINRKKEHIAFSDSTKYEIYDTFGNQIRNDEAKALKIKDLKKGLYYFKFVTDDKRSYSYYLNIKK